MLYHDFLTNTQRPATKGVSYFPVYERHFRKFVNQSVNFWEIGVNKGGSLQMWKRYFGPFAQIIGIDINPDCTYLKEDQIEICIGDQSDSDFLQNCLDKYGPPDVVLDDGSHVMSHIYASFSFLYDKLSKNGVYMVEDLCTSYWDEYEGMLRGEKTFIEQSKKMIDSLNAYYIRDEIDLSMRHFADSTYSVCFYSGAVVFEKAERLKASFGGLTVPNIRDLVLYSKSNEKCISAHDLLNKKVILFGAGSYGKMTNSVLKSLGINPVAFTDNNKCILGDSIDGVEIINIDKTIGTAYIYIISVKDRNVRDDIYKQLISMDVPAASILYAHINS